MTLRTAGELEILHDANRLVHAVLDGVEARIAPGASTAELDRWAETYIREAGAAPAFLHYRGYPATLCTSIDDVIVHGIPNDELLPDGCIVGVDCGVSLEGFFGDAARTFTVGAVSEEARRLLTVTAEALQLATLECRPGNRLSDVGWAVQRHAEAHGYSVVREFVGHGIGTALHEDPQVPNYGPPGRGPKLVSGMVLAIEPMINVGGPETALDADGWTARTADGSLSAHFEHSVAITADGPRVLGVTKEAGAEFVEEEIGDSRVTAS